VVRAIERLFEDPGEEEVFIWFDAYYIRSCFPEGEYFRGIEGLNVDGVEVERIGEIEVGRRAPGLDPKDAHLYPGVQKPRAPHLC
jgi:hypothetical protein